MDSRQGQRNGQGLTDGKEEKVTGGDSACVSCPCLRCLNIHTSMNVQHSALCVLIAYADAQQCATSGLFS